MLFGGIKCKEMKFNPASAGVSGVLLLLSVVGNYFPFPLLCYVPIYLSIPLRYIHSNHLLFIIRTLRTRLH